MYKTCSLVKHQLRVRNAGVSLRFEIKLTSEGIITGLLLSTATSEVLSSIRGCFEKPLVSLCSECLFRPKTKHQQ